MARNKKNKKKVPANASQGVKNSRKTPHVNENPESFYHLNPSWRFSRVDTCHESWNCTLDNIDQDLINRLISFERQTWGELLRNTSGRTRNTQNHLIDFAAMKKEAQERAKELQLDLEDGLMSLAISGKKRLLGVMRKEVFFLVWYDKNHEVCPTTKRYT